MSASFNPQASAPRQTSATSLPLSVALTGATGFVGRYCAASLAQRGCDLTLLQRTADRHAAPDRAHIIAVGDLADANSRANSRANSGAVSHAMSHAVSHADLVAALAGTDALVHLAGRAHRAVGTGAEALALYRAHNTAPTLAFARAAADAGVRHMIFASTSYVHGHVTEPGHPFDSASALNPTGAYAASKAEAEEALRQLAPELGLAVTIIRPAVVHGPNPAANIRMLLSAVRRGIPLPFGAIRNRRSFLGQENLSSFIAHALANPPQPGSVAAWTLADADTPATPDFVRMLGAAVGRKPMLAPFPPALLRRGLVLAGRTGMAESLIDSFEIDLGPVISASGWRPPLTLAQGLAQMARETF